jgi:assimilatory nitrate reductase catalytic subunit
MHLPVAMGSDVALFDGLLAYLIETGAVDSAYIARHTTGLAKPNTDIDTAAHLCALPRAALLAFYAEFAGTQKVVTVYSQGVNQSASGVDKVNAIVNCHLAMGRIGLPGMGPFSVTGQPNAMGGREVGALANQLAAHMDFAHADVDRVARFWQAPRIATKPGLKAVDLFAAIERGEIEAVWIMATNPAASLPDADRVARALARCKFVVVSDCVADTDTLKHAYVKLPALGWGEKDGTVTNSERRISRQRPFLPTPGEAKPDWWIVSQVAKRLGAAFDYAGPADIFAEHVALSAFENDGSRDFDLSGLIGADYETLRPTQWPVLATGETERMFARGGFFAPGGKARMLETAPRPPVNETDIDYPFALNTGRVRDQWHTMTRTGLSPRLASHLREPFVVVSPTDAKRLGLAEGKFARVATRWGGATLRARIDAGQTPGTIFAPMHWTGTHAADARVNAAVNPAVDPISGQPELKHSPARLAVWKPVWEGFLLRRDAVRALPLDYWIASAGHAHTRYDIADSSALDIDTLVGTGTRLEYRDDKGGRSRIASFDGDRLMAVLFVGPHTTLPDGAWLASLFVKSALSIDERRALLAGRPGGAIDQGQVVCACHGIREGTIDAAIAAGCASAASVGAATKAGTNCGACVPELAARLAACAVRAA